MEDKDPPRTSSSDEADGEDVAAMQAALREMVKIPDIESRHKLPTRGHLKIEQHDEIWSQKLKKNTPEDSQQKWSKLTDQDLGAQSSSSAAKRSLSKEVEKSSKKQSETWADRLLKSTKSDKTSEKSKSPEKIKESDFQHPLMNQRIKMLRIEAAATPKTNNPSRSPIKHYMASTQRPEHQPITVATNTDAELEPTHITHSLDPSRQAGSINILSVPFGTALSLAPAKDEELIVPQEQMASSLHFKNLPVFGRRLVVPTVKEAELKEVQGSQAFEEQVQGSETSEELVQEIEASVSASSSPSTSASKSAPASAPSPTLSSPLDFSSLKRILDVVERNLFVSLPTPAPDPVSPVHTAAVPAAPSPTPSPSASNLVTLSAHFLSTDAAKELDKILVKSSAESPPLSAASVDLVAPNLAPPSSPSTTAVPTSATDSPSVPTSDPITDPIPTPTSASASTSASTSTPIPLPAPEASLSTAISVTPMTSEATLSISALDAVEPRPDQTTEHNPTEQAEETRSVAESIASAFRRFLLKPFNAKNRILTTEASMMTNEAGPSPTDAVILIPSDTQVEKSLKNEELKAQMESIKHTDSMQTLTIQGRHSHITSICTDHYHPPVTSGIDKKAVRKLVISCILCVVFMTVMIIGGVASNSLAIATDAAHLLTDLAAFLISLFALYLAGRASTDRFNFGWHRAEVIGAMISVYFIWVITGILVWLAIQRMIEGAHEVDAIIMLITSGVAIVLNLIMALQLSHGHSHTHHQKNIKPEPVSTDTAVGVMNPSGKEPNLMHTSLMAPEKKAPKGNINVRAAIIHVVGDIVQSIGVFCAACVIFFKPEWAMIDSICTFVFSIIVVAVTYNILKDVMMVLMEAAPDYMDYGEVQKLFLSIEGVQRVYNLRIWALSIDKIALSAHLAINKDADPHHILEQAKTLIHKRYNFYETTIQVEIYNEHGHYQDHDHLPNAPLGDRLKNPRNIGTDNPTNSLIYNATRELTLSYQANQIRRDNEERHSLGGSTTNESLIQSGTYQKLDKKQEQQ